MSEEQTGGERRFYYAPHTPIDPNGSTSDGRSVSRVWSTDSQRYWGDSDYRDQLQKLIQRIMPGLRGGDMTVWQDSDSPTGFVILVDAGIDPQTGELWFPARRILGPFPAELVEALP